MTIAKAVVTGIVYRAPEKRFTSNDVAVSTFVLDIGEKEETLMRIISKRTVLDGIVSSFNKGDKKLISEVMEDHKALNPYTTVSQKDSREKIKEGIVTLPEKQRLVLSLYYYEDLNLKEIGRVLDVTESRVSQLHTQAIIRLKSKLRTHWDDVTTLLG